MTCYRHPDREAFVRCQRCERFICPDCQFEAAVGFLCPEDAGQNMFVERVTQMAPPRTRNRIRTARNRIAGGAPVISYLVIAICLLVWLGQILIPNDWVTYNFAYVPLATEVQPWRMLTAGFLHDPSSPIHLAFNMYSLWIFGGILESALGRARYLVLLLASMFGGSVAVLWLAQPTTMVLGASGGIFGLMAAYFVVLKTVGGNTSQMVVLIAINLAFGFFVSGVSWQAHVGGLLTGGAIALIYSRAGATARSRRQTSRVVLVVLGVLVLIAYAGWQVNLAPLFG